MAYELKTKVNDGDVLAFLNAVDNQQRREDALVVLDILQQETGCEPKMWGDAIIGFGESRLKYPDGREIDWMKIAFSPRKQNLVLYLSQKVLADTEQLRPLGKHKSSKACLYLTKLSDVNQEVLRQLIRQSLQEEQA